MKTRDHVSANEDGTNTFFNTEYVKTNVLQWHMFEEYCIGDKNSKYVTHNHVSGTWTFHN